MITKEYLRPNWAEDTPRLRAIGAISADVGGAIECTARCTEVDNPVYVYDPFQGSDY